MEVQEKETIKWIDANEHKPDCEITVLCWAGDEFFCGWWDSDTWRDATAMPCKVEFWAEPQGPWAMTNEDLEATW